MLKLLSTKITFDQFLFSVVALIGIILFSFKITTAPFMNDELDVVLNRASFDSLREVYLNTLTTDTHPPLMLFFFFYWLKVTGGSIFLVKLPFLLAGIASIFLIYTLVKNWFNSNVAILTTAFFVSIQFTVMYSQFARPYILGLFFCLLYANYWTKIVKNKGSLLNYLVYILMATLCVYNHHYSMLQAVIIGVSGLFIIKKDQLSHYLIINVVVCLLCLPNFYLIITQINYDSARTYIPEANLEHILNYFFYIFQFSIVSVLLVMSISLYALLKSKNILTNKYTIVSLIWFLSPLIIGCIVSAIVQPVMPIRALIFSFPFLIIFLFSFVQKINKIVIIILTILILTSNIYALVFKRKHYQIFQKNIGKSSVENIKQLLEDKQIETPYVFYDYARYCIQFYWEKELSDYNFDTPFDGREIGSYKPKEFRDKIVSLDNDAIILCGMPKNLISITKEYYPYLIYEEKGFLYDFYCFSKSKIADLEFFFFTSSIDFENEKEDLNNSSNKIIFDSTSFNHYYQFSDGDEWGPVLEIDLGKIIDGNTSCIIETEVSVLCNDTNKQEGILVFEISNGDENIIWYGSEINDFISQGTQWQKVYFSEQLNILHGSDKLISSSKLKVYFWNKQKRPIAVDNISVRIKNGNDELYSLLQDF